MSDEVTQAEADQHNVLTDKGWAILNDYILLAEGGQARVGFLGKRRLKKAIAFFEEALGVAPDTFSSKWALGKIYQALGDSAEALRWFEGALWLEQTNADVWREASLAAMDCEQFDRALTFSDNAITLEPADAGLHCNRALALMFLDRDAEATGAVTRSLQINSTDSITLNVQSIVNAVADGSRPRPRSMKELLG